MHLEIDIDSEVYPELHASLLALSSPRARAERVRLLAASGLMWEKVRLHGAAAVDLTLATPAVPAATAAAPQPAVAAPPRDDIVTRADVVAPPAPGTVPLPALERRSPKRTRASAKARDGADFVDLALNAEPSPVPPAPPPSASSRSERRGPRPSRHDVEQVIRELPVLMDVVADVRPLSDTEIEAQQAQALDDEPAPWAAMNAYPDDVPPMPVPDKAAAAGSAADDDTLELPDAALHVTALSHKPATRSRLMRMKERGLFKNG